MECSKRIEVERIAMSGSDPAYLARRLARFVTETVMDSKQAVMDVQREATARGALGNSRVFILYDKAVGEVLQTALIKMANAAYHTSGKTDEAAQALESAGFKIVEEVVSWLAGVYRNPGRLADTGPSTGKLNAYLREMVRHAIDDFHNGMTGDGPLKKEEAVSVTNTITNSPGAALQAAVGSNNQLSLQQQSSAVGSAIESLLNSDEFKALAPEDQSRLRDQAEALQSEIASKTGDVSKAKRWAKSIFSLAKELGLHTAAALFAKGAFAALRISP
jgi:hypothetical protein